MTDAEHYVPESDDEPEPDAEPQENWVRHTPFDYPEWMDAPDITTMEYDNEGET